MIQKNEEILDQRLGLNQKTPQEQQKRIRPLGRKSWAQASAKFEADKRQEYWKNKMEEVEKGVQGITKEETK